MLALAGNRRDPMAQQDFCLKFASTVMLTLRKQTMVDGGDSLRDIPSWNSCERPPIAILGVPFDNVTTAQAIALIERMVASGQPHYLATANVDFLVQAQADVELRRILLEAHMVVCDGTPLLWASRLLGNPLPERVAGADLAPLLIRVAAEKKYRVFFLGATPASAQQAVVRMQAAHPGLIIAGHYSPPFNSLLELNHDEIRRRILEAKPDLLFVAFGCPKAEKWMAMHYRSLGVPVAAGVGATIDFLAGQVRRAPRWMQRSGTEWLFRLAQEPRRLAGRYTKDMFIFGFGILAQIWHLRFRGWPRPGLGSPSDEVFPLASASSRAGALENCLSPSLSLVATEPATHTNGRNGFSHSDRNGSFTSADLCWNVVRLPARLDLSAVRENGFVAEDIADQHCLLDVSGVEFIDSTGLGFLIRWHKKLRTCGSQLVLIAPSRAVQRALRVTRLEDFFASAPNVAAAKEVIATRAAEQAAVVTRAAATRMAWQGEVTAANVEAVWEQTHAQLSTCEPPANLVIDLSRVRFIDSSGLGLMVRAKKMARKRRTPLTFTGLQPPVRNVVRMAHLEEFLLNNLR